jgi:hypothetical protein
MFLLNESSRHQETEKKHILLKHSTCKIAGNNPSQGKFKLEEMWHFQNSQARRGGDHGIPCQEISTAILLCLGNMEDLILTIRNGLACD